MSKTLENYPDNRRNGPFPARLWSVMASHPRNQNGPSRCTLKMRSCGHHSGQSGDCHMPWTYCHPDTWPCPSPRDSVFHLVWSSSASSPWSPSTCISPISLLIQGQLAHDQWSFIFQMNVYPPSQMTTIVCSIHDSPTTGHAGCFRTKTLLEWDFW